MNIEESLETLNHKSSICKVHFEDELVSPVGDLKCCVYCGEFF